MLSNFDLIIHIGKIELDVSVIQLSHEIFDIYILQVFEFCCCFLVPLFLAELLSSELPFPSPKYAEPAPNDASSFPSNPCEENEITATRRVQTRRCVP